MTDLPEFSFDFGTLVPSLLLALAAVFLPMLYRITAEKFLQHTQKHMASWLHILLESYVVPFAMILRVYLVLFMLAALPFDFFHEQKVVQVLDVGSDLLIVFFVGLGSWRAAPVTRLLLHSAENRLDLQTHQTMGRFFENIFHALVVVFTGIAMLDRLGVPVSGLLTGAGLPVSRWCWSILSASATMWCSAVMRAQSRTSRSAPPASARWTM